jgi:hypothetical protein
MDERTYNANLPDFLHRSAEQLAEERERQDRIRRDYNLKGARQTPAETAYARSFELEPVIRGNLAAVADDPEAYKETLLQLAEVKADQGEFAEASSLAAEAGNSDVATEYASRRIAVEIDDSLACNCPAETIRLRTPNGGQAAADIPSQFIAGEVYSIKHGRPMPLVRCAVCGFDNVTTGPPNPDLSPIEQDRIALPEAK